MTREEYVKWLKQLDESLAFDGLIDGDKEVDLHEMIFDLCEMLEQQTCEDAISRNLIIETLNKMDRYVADESTLCDTDKKFPHNEVFIVDDVYEQIVEQLPSVNPQPKTAHWIEHSNPYDIDGTYYCFCDNCGSDAHEKTDFCPSCGAKMVELQESEVSE